MVSFAEYNENVCNLMKINALHLRKSSFITIFIKVNHLSMVR